MGANTSTIEKPTIINDRYKLEKLIGKGSYGDIYLVSDHSPNLKENEPKL